VAGAHFGATLGSADFHPIAGAPNYSTPILHDAGFWGTLGDVGPNGQYEAHSAVGTQAGEHLGASMTDGQEGNSDTLVTLVGAPGMTIDGHPDAGAVFDYSWDSTETDDYFGMTTLTQDSKGVPGAAADRAEFGATIAVWGNEPYSSAAIGVPGATVAGHRDAGEVITGYLPGIADPLIGVKYQLISQGMEGVEGIEQTNAHFGESVGFAARAVGLNHPLRVVLEVGIPDEHLGTSIDCGQVELFHVRGNLPVPASGDLLGAPHRASGQLYGFSFQNTF
jgi:hypothetical protein